MADETSECLSDALARVGIVVTDEGTARARRRLVDARTGWTPARFAAQRARLGRPARPEPAP